MSIWWIIEPDRATRERSLIVDLREENNWISNIEFRLKDLGFSVDFDIKHEERAFQLRLVYPTVFPDTPPMIVSRDGTRISGHQYGSHGELCLEHRPDNWRPDITGADMILSCHHLLTSELERIGDGREEGSPIRDGHNLTLGQELRSKAHRFLLTSHDREALLTGLSNQFYRGSLRTSGLEKTWVARIFSLNSDSADPYFSSAKFSRKCGTQPCFVYFDDSSQIDLSELDSTFIDNIVSIASQQGFVLFDGKESFYLVIGNNKYWMLIFGAKIDGVNRIIPEATVHITPEKDRRHSTYENLANLKVGIVGCGSIGSKIGIQLARSGIKNFELVDDDIFLEENLVRNELRLENIGFHKSAALKETILSIDSTAVVFSRCNRLGGQESSAITSTILESLSKCNVVVDATACEDTFGYLASVCTKKKIPLVWCSVYAGGIGGIVARSRPLIDPTPKNARVQIDNIINQLDVIPPPALGQASYESESEDGRTEIADDSEVTLIASHAARFVVDAMIKEEDSIFPSSAYLIGLSKSWIFHEPFHVLPIKLVPEGEWGTRVDPANNDLLVEFIESVSTESII